MPGRRPLRLCVLIVFLIARAAAPCAAEGLKRAHRIGFVVTTLSNPFFVDMSEAARDEAAGYGDVEILLRAPERATDTDYQLQLVENLIVQKADVICMVPADSKSAVAAVVKANAAGIPLIVVDSRLDAATAKARGARTAAFIGSDNHAGGKLAGEFLSRRLAGQGVRQVAILEGMSGAEPAFDRREGFKAAVRHNPGIEIVAARPADWDREKGLNVTQDMLQAYPRLSGIFASNDEMALGAVQAVKLAGKSAQVTIVGFDAIREAVAAVERGELAATVAQRPAEMGRRAIDMAVRLLHGEEIPPETATAVTLVTAESPGA